VRHGRAEREALDGEGKLHGLITLEDVLKEIVGDIEDEHDRPTPKLSQRMKRQTAKQAATSALSKPPAPLRKWVQHRNQGAADERGYTRSVRH
jgi:hypothetical protein